MTVFWESPVFWLALLALVIFLGQALRKTVAANRRINADIKFLRGLPPKEK